MIQSTPVSLLAGFLGSGKSTLLNALLRSGELPPTAIIVNEFGETAIDNALIEGVTEGISLLGAGCVYCAVRSDLEATMRDLILKRARGVIPPFEAVIVEMSGLAEPGAVLQTIGAQSMRQVGYTLGPVLSTFDAVHGIDALHRYTEARHQIAVADRLVITKSDLVEDLAPVRTALAEINPQARVATAVRGAIAAEWVLGASRHADDPAAADPHVHHAHDHAQGLNSTTIWLDRPVDWTRFQRQVQSMLRKHGEHILRLKGILDLEGLDHPVAVHAVHHSLYPLERLAGWPDDDRRSRIVVIVDGMDVDTVVRELQLSSAAG